ncbi:mobilization protein, partial [Phocaeicola vulgatus]
MKEHSIKSVRLTPTVKARLDTFKGSDTVSVCVDRMITFFEITGFNPRYASKNPTALVEKRIEDLIKIIKSQERDIFKPILDKLAGMGGGLHESPDYARLMNEMHDLQERNRKLQQ